MERVCLECDEKVKGRSDKKYCSDYCRNSFNNRIKYNSDCYLKNVNNILKKNRRILGELMTEQVEKISKEKLVQKGFNFKYFTGIHTTPKGKKSYIFCYEYKLDPQGKFYLIAKKPENETSPEIS